MGAYHPMRFAWNQRRSLARVLAMMCLGWPAVAAEPAPVDSTSHEAPVSISSLGVVGRTLQSIGRRIHFGPSKPLTRAQRDSVARVTRAWFAAHRLVDPPARVEHATLSRGALELSCWIADSVARDVTVYRLESDGIWHQAGRARANRFGYLTWRDRKPPLNRDAEYGLGLRTRLRRQMFLLPKVFTGGGNVLRVRARCDSPVDPVLQVQLPVAGQARISVFDVAGRCLGTLDLPFLASGLHEIPVPRAMVPMSGVYFSRLEQGRASDCTRFVVVR